MTGSDASPKIHSDDRGDGFASRSAVAYLGNVITVLG
jgi:hypothetical protein